MFKLEVQFDSKAELVAFLTGGSAAAAAVSVKPEAPKTEAKAEAKKPEAKPEVKAAAVEKPAATTSSPKPSESAEAGEQTTDYPTLQAAVFKAAKINKAATLAIATELGSATFKELAPALWGTALTKVQALIDQAEVA
jgi:hypothetical protein